MEMRSLTSVQGPGGTCIVQFWQPDCWLVGEIFVCSDISKKSHASPPLNIKTELPHTSLNVKLYITLYMLHLVMQSVPQEVASTDNVRSAGDTNKAHRPTATAKAVLALAWLIDS